MDLIRELQSMTFASRLKRLGEQLKAEATRIYQANGVDFNDSSYLIAVALSRQDCMTVTDMAAVLGISHAAVSQLAAAMERKGQLSFEPDKSDGRKTLLCLTAEGRATIEALKPIWDAVGECTDELIESTGPDLLLVISKFEDQLKKQSLSDRVAQKLQLGHEKEEGA